MLRSIPFGSPWLALLKRERTPDLSRCAPLYHAATITHCAGFYCRSVNGSNVNSTVPACWRTHSSRLYLRAATSAWGPLDPLSGPRLGFHRGSRRASITGRLLASLNYPRYALTLFVGFKAAGVGAIEKFSINDALPARCVLKNVQVAANCVLLRDVHTCICMYTCLLCKRYKSM